MYDIYTFIKKMSKNIYRKYKRKCEELGAQPVYNIFLQYSN